MNKPVALIRQSKYGTPSLVWNGEFKYSSTVVKCDDIPLYTHPVKELTDEEIDELWDKYLSVQDEYGEELQILGVPEFAKAILRKAQEK